MLKYVKKNYLSVPEPIARSYDNPAMTDQLLISKQGIALLGV